MIVKSTIVNIYSTGHRTTFSMETSAGQNSNLYLNAVHFFNTIVNQKSTAA